MDPSTLTMQEIRGLLIIYRHHCKNKDRLANALLFIHHINDPITELILSIDKGFITNTQMVFNEMIQIKAKWPELGKTLMVLLNAYLKKGVDQLYQARILLMDYIKQDSSVNRFVSGHWNRHYTNEVTQWILAIDQGSIRTMADLMNDMQALTKIHPRGSLEKRFDFLLYQLADLTEVNNLALGCDLYLLSQLPDNITKYKGNYLVIDRNNTKAVYYVNSKGMKEKVRINDLDRFEKNLNDMKKQGTSSLHLSDDQCNQLITSNGGHTIELNNYCTELLSVESINNH